MQKNDRFFTMVKRCSRRFSACALVVLTSGTFACTSHDDFSRDATPGVIDAGPSDASSADAGANESDGAVATCTGTRTASEWMDWKATPVSPSSDAYQVAGGVVLDKQTCLMWQRDVSATRLDWSSARTGCELLVLAGFDDWRLPTAIELKSILDRGGIVPTVNALAFAGTPISDQEDWYWTSTPVVRDPTYSWAIGFLHGISTPSHISNTLYTRCVRGLAPVASIGAPAGRYVIDGDSVLDTTTGLNWTRSLTSTALTWAEADAHCQKLSVGGASWRLPTIVELESLVDVSRYNWSVDPTAFMRPTSPADDRFWTSTQDAPAPDKAWTVDFYHGNSSTTSKTLAGGYARCVH